MLCTSGDDEEEFTWQGKHVAFVFQEQVHVAPLEIHNMYLDINLKMWCICDFNVYRRKDLI